MQSEESKCEKTTYCMISIIWHPEKDKSIDMVKRSVVTRFVGREGEDD